MDKLPKKILIEIADYQVRNGHGPYQLQLAQGLGIKKQALFYPLKKLYAHKLLKSERKGQKNTSMLEVVENWKEKLTEIEKKENESFWVTPTLRKKLVKLRQKAGYSQVALGKELGIKNYQFREQGHNMLSYEDFNKIKLLLIPTEKGKRVK